MKPEILNPSQIFQKPIRYTVPAFQRRYVWTQDSQWEPLWDDVRNTVESYLEETEHPHKDGSKTPPHFLGAVVVQKVGDKSVTDIEQWEVIDGQQRMTTIQLLLDAVQYVLEKHEGPELKRGSRRLQKLVTNDEDYIGADESEVFKLWPTTDDREAFRHAMHNGLATDDFQDSLIVQAHEFFQLQVKEWLNSDPDFTQHRAQALEAAVSKMLQMVVIHLTSSDDPYVIFEILNARGTPLEESELIKNYTMSEASKSGLDQDGIWGDLSDDWWREETRQGRLYRPRIDMLLNYWLSMRSISEVRPNRVFREFKSLADPRPISNVMSEVKRDLGNYRRFETGPRTYEEEAFHYRTDVMQIGAITPALLLILSSPHGRQRINALRALESFLIRRMVCRASTRSYGRLALDLASEIKERGLENVHSAIFDFLNQQTAEATVWPDDVALEHALVSLPLYRVLTRGRLRLILEGIEEKLRQDDPMVEQTDVPKNLTIEHVMPQSWGRHWPLPNDLGAEEREEWGNNRNRLVHTIGNLTLVTRRLNPALSNAPWEDKSRTLGDHTVLYLNKTLLQESQDSNWDEEFIQARSKRMAKLVAEVWPGPDSPIWDR